MIDIVNSCRICLGNGAVYHIFNRENSEDILSKIALGLNEKIEYIEEYPSKICRTCKDTIEIICDFKSKYKESCEILESKIIKVKIEDNTSYSDNELYEHFLEICKKPKQEFEVQNNEILHKNILNSLTEITITKLTNEDSSQSSHNSDVKNTSKPYVKAKQPRKNVTKYNHSNKQLKKSCPNNNNKDQIRQYERKNSKEKVKEKSKPTILCDICGQTFSKYSLLNEHKRTHSKNKFECDKCSRTYLLKHSLTDHILKVHEKIKKATCHLCGIAFYGKKELNSHTKVVHDKIKAKRKIYKCRFCDKSYNHKRGFVCHERSVHTGERPAVCSVCNAAFYDDVYLREHMRLHTGSNPFKCPICNRGYAQLGNMKSHMRNHKISELGPDIVSKIKPNYIKYLRP